MKTIYVSYLLPLKATADLHDTASEVEIVDDIDGSTGYTIAHIMSSMRNNSECFVGMLNGSVCIDPATLSRKFNAYLVEAEPDVRESHASYAYKNLRPILYYHLNDRPFNFDEKLQDKWAGFIQLQKKFANIIASVYEDGDQSNLRLNFMCFIYYLC